MKKSLEAAEFGKQPGIFFRSCREWIATWHLFLEAAEFGKHHRIISRSYKVWNAICPYILRFQNLDSVLDLFLEAVEFGQRLGLIS